jgi:hypothetical protein
LFVLAVSWLSAQVLQPNYQSAFEKQHHFNPEVIKKHKVKRITFDIIDKKDFEVAVDKNLTEVYEFNDSALLSRYYYTAIIRTVEKEYFTKPLYRKRRLVKPAERYTRSEYIYDTISNTYLYNNSKYLLVKRFTDGNGIYQSYYFKQDSVGRVTHEQRIRETNVGSEKGIFVLGNQVVMSTDSFQYKVLTSVQTKQLFFNNENRVYKERIWYKKDSMHVTDIDEYYVTAWIIQKQHFEYDKNRLTFAEFKGNANGDITLKRTYEYDEKNELISEKQYKNGVLTAEISYITDASSQLLSSFIIRDQINKTMRIVKLKYDFWTLPTGLNSKN